jgi:hypothetical protein
LSPRIFRPVLPPPTAPSDGTATLWPAAITDEPSVYAPQVMRGSSMSPSAQRPRVRYGPAVPRADQWRVAGTTRVTKRVFWHNSLVGLQCPGGAATIDRGRSSMLNRARLLVLTGLVSWICGCGGSSPAHEWYGQFANTLPVTDMSTTESRGETTTVLQLAHSVTPDELFAGLRPPSGTKSHRLALESQEGSRTLADPLVLATYEEDQTHGSCAGQLLFWPDAQGNGSSRVSFVVTQC